MNSITCIFVYVEIYKILTGGWVVGKIHCDNVFIYFNNFEVIQNVQFKKKPQKH
jgi:hypothetical protein